MVNGGFPSATTTNSTGYYTATVNQGSTLTVTPSLSGYTFAPPNQIHTNVTTNQTNQNFTAAANSSVTPGAGGGGGGGCFINASINGLPLGLLSFALLLLMTAIRYFKTRRKTIFRSTEQF